jgi:hypothetical protein
MRFGLSPGIRNRCSRVRSLPNDKSHNHVIPANPSESVEQSRNPSYSCSTHRTAVGHQGHRISLVSVIFTLFVIPALSVIPTLVPSGVEGKAGIQSYFIIPFCK